MAMTDTATEPLVSRYKAHPADRDLNSSPSPSPSPPPHARVSSSAIPPTTGAPLPWIPIAAGSGACAAINGVFAKLTTTELTTSWATAISHGFGLKDESKFIEVLIRVLFFALNLTFNALMWALFTAALTRASSTTRVSIINTSANFMLTAFSGWLIFGEKLSPLWWVGAGGLVVGNVVIGRRDEEGEGPIKRGSVLEADRGRSAEGRREGERERYRDSAERDGIIDGVRVELQDTERRDTEPRDLIR